MSLALIYRPRYILKDFNTWQGGGELVEGIPYALASPNFWHQNALVKISDQIDASISTHCPNCYGAIDLDWIISEDRVLPDIVIFCHEPEERLTKALKIIRNLLSLPMEQWEISGDFLKGALPL